MKHIVLVFVALNFRHHLLAQVSSSVIAVCALVQASSKVSVVMKIAMSSAYSPMMIPSECGMSLMIMLKSVGLRHEPCGTPLLISFFF